MTDKLKVVQAELTQTRAKVEELEEELKDMRFALTMQVCCR